jgi:hypothetical protein
MTDLVVSTLTTLAQEINEEHRRATSAVSEALAHARRAGQLLAEAKAQLPHGDWLPWLEANCEVSERSAQAYMRIANNWPELEKSAAVADLPMRDALRMLAAPRLDDGEAMAWLSPELQFELDLGQREFDAVRPDLERVTGRIKDALAACDGPEIDSTDAIRLMNLLRHEMEPLLQRAWAACLRQDYVAAVLAHEEGFLPVFKEYAVEFGYGSKWLEHWTTSAMATLVPEQVDDYLDRCERKELDPTQAGLCRWVRAGQQRPGRGVTP